MVYPTLYNIFYFCKRKPAQQIYIALPLISYCVCRSIIESQVFIMYLKLCISFLIDLFIQNYLWIRIYLHKNVNVCVLGYIILTPSPAASGALLPAPRLLRGRDHTLLVEEPVTAIYLSSMHGNGL